MKKSQDFNSTELRDYLNSIESVNPEIILEKKIEEKTSKIYSGIIQESESGGYSEENNKAVVSVFNQICVEFNEKYKLDVSINFDNFSDALKYIIDPRKKRAVELYMSETYSRFRVLIYLKMMKSIMLLADEILDPKNLLSESTTYADKFLMVEKLFSFMTTVNKIYTDLNIQSADLELQNLSDNSMSEDLDINSDNVLNFLDALKKSVNGTEHNNTNLL